MIVQEDQVCPENALRSQGEKRQQKNVSSFLIGYIAIFASFFLICQAKSLPALSPCS